MGGENEGGLRALPFGRKAKRGESETERAGSPAAGWRTGREQKAVSAEVTRRSAAEVQSHRPGLADDRARRLPRPSARPSARRVCSGPCSAGSALCPATCAGERGEGFAVTSECRNGFSVLVTQQTEYPTERVRFSGHVSAPVGVRVSVSARVRTGSERPVPGRPPQPRAAGPRAPLRVAWGGDGPDPGLWRGGPHLQGGPRRGTDVAPSGAGPAGGLWAGGDTRPAGFPACGVCGVDSDSGSVGAEELQARVMLVLPL